MKPATDSSGAAVVGFQAVLGIAGFVWGIVFIVVGFAGGRYPVPWEWETGGGVLEGLFWIFLGVPILEAVIITTVGFVGALVTAGHAAASRPDEPVVSHPRVVRDGMHLRTQVALTRDECLRGAVIPVGTLGDRVLPVSIPPGTVPGQTLRVAGEGVVGPAGRGDLLIVIAAG